MTKEKLNLKKLIGMNINEYTITKYISSGSYGDVFEALNNKTNKYVALKIPIKTEEKNGEKWILEEAKVYKELNSKLNSLDDNDMEISSNADDKDTYNEGQEGISSIKVIKNKELDKKIIVMDLLGPSLESLLQEKKKFSLKTIILLTIQMLKTIRYIHDKGYIHRDIKPENFVMDAENKNKLYFIDFGLAKKYIKKNGEHIQFKDSETLMKKIKILSKKLDNESNESKASNIEKEIYKIKTQIEQRKHKFCGTARYASIAAHKGYEQSRKDDLESIGYVLVYLYKTRLPWQGIKNNDKKIRYKLIKEKKESISNEELCDKLPREFCVFFNYVKTLDFDERPRYTSLIKMFTKLYNSKDYKNDKFDWE